MSDPPKRRYPVLREDETWGEWESRGCPTILSIDPPPKIHLHTQDDLVFCFRSEERPGPIGSPVSVFVFDEAWRVSGGAKD